VLLSWRPLAGILYSYSKIISSICEISLLHSKYNPFSTCATFLSVVSLYYFRGLGACLSSALMESSHSTEGAWVMYNMVTPMPNPFIYILRNKDIKSVLKRLRLKQLKNQLCWKKERSLMFLLLWSSLLSNKYIKFTLWYLLFLMTSTLHLFIIFFIFPKAFPSLDLKYLDFCVFP
jgi:hypothetical protein